MEQNESRARRVAVMSALALSEEGAFGECCGSVYNYMALLKKKAGEPSFVVCALLLFIRLDSAVRRATANTISTGKSVFFLILIYWLDLVGSMQMPQQIFDWIDVVNSVLTEESAQLAECLEYRAAMVLIEGQTVLLLAATSLEQNGQLVGLVSIELYKLLERLQQFAGSRSEGGSESYGMQLLKIACLELICAYLTALDAIGQRDGLKFFERQHMLLIFDLQAARPQSHLMTPLQSSAWSDLQVSFSAAKWRLVASAAMFFGASGVVEVKETFERCMLALETAKYNGVPAIMGCLAELLELLPVHDLPYEMIKESLLLGQDLLDNHYDAPRWFDVYAVAYLEYALHPVLLSSNPSDEVLHGPTGIVRTALNHALESICPKRRGLANRLAERLFSAWTGPTGKTARSQYIDETLALLLYGPMRDSSEDHMASRGTQLELTGDETADTISDHPSHDYLTRVYMLTMLNRLDPSDPEDHDYALTLLTRLLQHAQGKDEAGMDANKRAFPNAIQHRRRLRAWQAALLLQPMLSASDFTSGVESDLWACIVNEPLPSTRAYIEWFLARCYVGFDESIGGLFSQLAEWERPAAQSVSCLTVTLQVALHLPIDRPETVSCLSDLLAAIGPYCTDANAQTKITAAWTLRRIWSHCLTHLAALSPVISTAPKIIESMVEYLGRPALAKSIAKQGSSPTLSGYDILSDFSVEFILQEYPRALGMANDELVPPHSFRLILASHGMEQNTLLCPIYQGNESKKLSSFVAEDVPISSTPLQDGTAEGADLFKDYQRKLAVWDLALLDQDLATFRRNRELEKRRSVLGETIVCASLVSKIPNLAGLSRSCEIFGATKLILPDAAMQHDPHFRAISMTSDKWLQIEAVPPADLISYLESCRRQGFRILAVEQTASSQPLQSYTFPSRYLLLLGNEASGIPPELLHVVDDCIEIPQNGMVRSLNVHVCGSIVLWESRRQLYVREPAAVGISLPTVPSPANTIS